MTQSSSFELDQLPVTAEDIVQAAAQLEGVANKTPVMTSRSINSLTKAEVFFKCENFQRTGSFKFRGAYNAMSRLKPEQRSGGVLTYSSGNHAQAIALSGQLLNIPTTVIMPDDAPPVKQAATRQYGAEVILYDRAEMTREALCQELAKERQATIIPPFNHPHVIAGQGTVAYELIQHVGQLDWLLVCCGGGGLLSGCAIAAHALSPNCRVVGVEPAAGDDAARSFRTKTLQTVHNPETIADGARTHSLGSLTFPLVMHYVHDILTVPDEALARQLFYLWERMKLVIEPTGALAATALLEGMVDVTGCRVGVIISGGNVSLDRIAQLLH